MHPNFAGACFPATQVVSRKLIRDVHGARIYLGLRFLRANHSSCFTAGGEGIRGLRESGLPSVGRSLPLPSAPISVKFDHAAIRRTIRDDPAVDGERNASPLSLLFSSLPPPSSPLSLTSDTSRARETESREGRLATTLKVAE